MFKKGILSGFSVFALILMYALGFSFKDNQLPLVSIANYGPHPSLSAAIEGFKAQMKEEGYVEGRTIRYQTADVGFDSSLIFQMLSSQKIKSPKLMLVLTTPVAQAAKSKVKEIPLIYTVITNPVEASLLKEADKANGNMTGSSDMQDVKGILTFAKKLLPKASRVGLLYSTSESNDVSLVKMMKQSALALNLSVQAVPVEQARDVGINMQAFRDKVDFIYVGGSGLIQPTLPVIAAKAREMNIPIFNLEEQAVRDGLSLASFGVDYKAVGRKAGLLAGHVLRGEKVSELSPLYPTPEDSHAVVNKSLAKKFKVQVPLGTKVVG